MPAIGAFRSQAWPAPTGFELKVTVVYLLRCARILFERLIPALLIDLTEETILKRPQWTRRPAHSLLFITEAKSFRVDADRQGVLLGSAQVFEHGCRNPSQLANSVAKIAEQSPRLGRKLWILCLRLPALLVSVPSLQIQGIDQNALMQALQFEAEGITGVSSLDSRIAFQLLSAENDMSDFWLLQLEKLAWDDLQRLLKNQRCSLGGLLHPAGLPLAMHNSEAQDWLRLETWAGQLMALHVSEQQRSWQSFNLESPHWRPELEQWLTEQGPVAEIEILQNNRIEMLLDAPHLYSLRENEQVEQWLALWAEALIVRQAQGVALLKPIAEIDPELVWRVGSGVVALLLCSLHGGWFVYQTGYYERETQRLTEAEKALAEIRKQIADSTAERDKLDARLNKFFSNPDWLPQTVRQIKHRPAELMRSLAEGRDEQLIIESLESKGNEVTVGGISLQQNLSNQLASYLQNQLAEHHWQVGAATKENMALFAEEPGPWTFKLVLTDQGIPGLLEPKK